MKYIALVVFVFLLIFLRFYNVSYTARFTEDESGFLVRVHEIYQERKVTLVGQVNEQGTKVFGSLSVYLLLPFAILGKFNPISVFYGAAFWGVLTGIAFLYLSKLINRKLTILAAMLILVWFPLVQTGRWAWNPNFIPLWVSLGIACYLKRKQSALFLVLSGIFFGLSVHQHYYALFGTSVFILIIAIEGLYHKNVKDFFLPGIGFVLTLLPFLIFDLRHPPGLFILGASKQAHVTILSQVFANALNFGTEILKSYTQSVPLFVILTIAIFALCVFDIVKKSKSLIFFIPCFLQIIVISILGLYFPHYFYVNLAFFFVWIIYPRVGIVKYLAYAMVLMLIIGGLVSIRTQLIISPVVPDLPTVVKIISILKNEIENQNIKNVNIVVLAIANHNKEE